eukprot:1150874-Pelagomonas_calceolata.AAC.3
MIIGVNILCFNSSDSQLLSAAGQLASSWSPGWYQMDATTMQFLLPVEVTLQGCSTGVLRLLAFLPPLMVRSPCFG